MIPLVVLMLVLGLAPGKVLDTIQPSVKYFVQNTHNASGHKYRPDRGARRMAAGAIDRQPARGAKARPIIPALRPAGAPAGQKPFLKRFPSLKEKMRMVPKGGQPGKRPGGPIKIERKPASKEGAR